MSHIPRAKTVLTVGILFALVGMTALTTVMFFYNTTQSVTLKGVDNPLGINIRANITIWTNLYENIPAPVVCDIIIRPPDGPKNVTVHEFSLYLQDMHSAGLYFVNVFYDPFLEFYNTQEVRLHEEFVFVPSAASPECYFFCRLEIDTENRTWKAGVSGGPMIYAVPVNGWTMHPQFWAAMSGIWCVVMVLLWVRGRRAASRVE